MELFKLFGTIAIDNAEANDSLDETGDKAKKAAKDIADTGDEGEKSEGKLSKAFSKMGDAAAKVGKAITTGLAAASVAVVKIGKDAITAYADYEQLVGGVETLFKDSADTVIKNASNAYKTAGMSANEYMETVTSFSASLLQSLGGDTVAAAEQADMAITDMSDNANKMGTDIAAIQNAYQGFAKQNYTMLDNLKLGYGGTREEMLRLLEDATALSGVEYDISSYADIVDAIHVVQTELGITGTTAKEASTTIQGSISSLKGAWQNLLVGLADDTQNFDALVNDVFDSLVTVGDNLLPRISVVLDGVANLVNKLGPKIVSKIPGILSTLLPAVTNGAVAIVNSIVTILPGLFGTLINVLPDLISAVNDVFRGLVDALPELMQLIVEALPTLIPQLITGLVDMITYLATNFIEIIQPLIDNLPEIIISIVNALMDNLPVLIEGCIQLIIGLVGALPEIILGLIEAIPTIVKSILEGLWNALPAFIEGLVSIVSSIFTTLWNLITGIFSPIIDWFKELFTNAWEGIKEAWSVVAEWFGGVWDGITNAFADVKDWFVNMFSGAWDGIKNIWDKVTGFFSGIWEGIKSIFSGVGDWFSNIFSRASDAIKNVFGSIADWFKGVFDKIADVVKAPINFVIRGLNKLIGGLNKISFDIPDWVPLIGGKHFGFNLQSIAELEKGGVVEEPTPAIFGEHGAEAVVPLENNTQWIQKVAEQINVFQETRKLQSKEVIPEVFKKSADIQMEQVNAIDLVNEKIDQLLSILTEYFPGFMDRMQQSIILDDGTLIGRIAPQMDVELGRIYSKKGRGNA